MKFIKKYFFKNLILVKVINASDESIISYIIASFQNVEILGNIFTLDQSTMLHNFKKIDLQSTNFMTRHILNIKSGYDLIKNIIKKINIPNIYNSKHYLNLIIIKVKFKIILI